MTKHLFPNLPPFAADEEPSVEGLKRSHSAASLPEIDVPDFSADRPNNAPSDHDASTLPGHESGMLDEELMTFSSVEPIYFPFQYQNSDSTRYFGALRWRQLVSYWQHDAVVKHLIGDQAIGTLAATTNKVDLEDSLVSSHDLIANESINVLVLNRVQLPNHTEARGSECRFFFLSQLFSPVAANLTPVTQTLPPQSEPSSGSLIKLAESNVDILSTMLDTVIDFACNDLIAGVAGTISYTVSLKDILAIDMKAKRKYDGDVLQVKDVLRGSIIFPNEGSLLCGLIRLAQICDDKTDWEVKGQRLKLELVRVKNLFSSESPIGGLDRSPLPTGYRHVLANVRVDGGVLVGRFLAPSNRLYARL
jgi:hypothetical protein